MPLARVAIVFDNFGPYHWARLEAAGRVCKLIAIEVRDNCMEHGWVRQSRSSPFQTITLVKVASGKKPRRRDLVDRLGKVLGEFKPQVVFLPGWSCAAAFIAHQWCSINGVPTVVMSESNSWDEERSRVKEWVKRRLVSNYSAALVGGHTHKDYLVKLGLGADRIFLGYDAVDNDYFAAGAAESRKQKAETRKRFGLPEKFFLASARFVEKKNLQRLIEAYARYRELASNSALRTPHSALWDLVLLGDGPLRSSILDLRSSLGLDDHVHLSGFKQYDELPAHYGLASAFVHASTTEQWGLVVNEAMASGLPVLISDRCGSASDLVKTGQNGFTFDPRAVEQIAQTMLTIAGMREEDRNKLGQAGGEIISHWSPERFGQGVRMAVEKAASVGARRISFFDRALLQLLATLK